MTNKYPPFQESCPKCLRACSGELQGDDDCRYYKFVCVACNKKWTRLAVSVKPTGTGQI